MKKLCLAILGCCLSVLAMAQAKPYYSQYILNNYILNPAVAGIENYTDVKLSLRNQWTGIEGHPTTEYISIHAPLGKSDYRTSATSFQVPGDNPRGPKYIDEYQASAAHQGIGLIAMNDKAGYINRWSAYATYAYHKPISVKTTLSAGLSVGVSSVSIDRSKIVWGNLDPNDPAIGYASGDLKKIKPEVGAGLWLYGARYFIGASVLNIIPGKAKFVKADNYGTYFTPNYFVTAGYKFFLNDEFSLLPSAMLQYWQPQLMGIHTNIKLQYMDDFWIGASYRFSDVVGGYSAMVGLNISNTFNISYAYENATTSRLRTYTGQTHEIMLGFLLNNKYGETCPRNVW
jgi:type IX secretion system PorP/SprF family membrane protein